MNVVFHHIQLIGKRDDGLFGIFQQFPGEPGKARQVMCGRLIISAMNHTMETVQAVIQEMRAHLQAPNRILEFIDALLGCPMQIRCLFPEIPEPTTGCKQQNASCNEKVAHHGY